MPDAKRVLVVDDDAEIRGLLTTILVRRNLTVDQAVDGSEALDLLARNKYAVVLLDLMMPKIDGFAVLDAIHASNLPAVVLVVTAADRSQLQQLDEKRIHGIVRKPFDPEALGDVVVQCTEIRSRGSFEAMAISTIIATIPCLALLTVNT
jgi:two-component system, OmpR family, response regulator ResD